MEKMEFQKQWKKLVMCMAVLIAVFTALKAVPVYAGDFTTAATLPTNGQWSAKYVLAQDTTDYYKFTISTAGAVDIKLMAYTPSSLECTLYDSNFDKITYEYSSGSETSPKTESMVRWLSQGTYYVSVSQSSGKGGNYKLYASLSSSGITAADKDSYDSPQVMSVNSKVSGVMTVSNKEDWYKVTISSAGKYRQICQSSDTMECSLYDVNLSRLNYLYCLYADTDIGDIELKPGTYYIEIKGRYGGTYTCEFNEVIPAKGDILTDSDNQAQYTVTKAGKSGGTVTYQKSMSSMKNSITVPATVTIEGITYNVTGIAADAFKGNSMLKKVTIGKNVASIGANAFYGCIGLKSITIPANVSSIGKKAFYDCRNLKTVTIKTKKLTASKVGASAFKGIHKKATIKIPKSKFKAYKGILKKKGAGKGVKYKKV